jgi:hypothetical protein
MEEHNAFFLGFFVVIAVMVLGATYNIHTEIGLDAQLKRACIESGKQVITGPNDEFHCIAPGNLNSKDKQ